MTPIHDEKSANNFLKNVRRGRMFEREERAQWKGPVNEQAQFEAPTEWEGRRGRIDIRLTDPDEAMTVLVELKARNWDSKEAAQVRPTVLRDARQIERYIEGEVAQDPSQAIVAAIVYCGSPIASERRAEIESILNEHGIQVVWRDGLGRSDSANSITTQSERESVEQVAKLDVSTATGTTNDQIAAKALGQTSAPRQVVGGEATSLSTDTPSEVAQQAVSEAAATAAKEQGEDQDHGYGYGY